MISDERKGKGQFLKYCYLIRWINVQLQVTGNQLWLLSTLEPTARSGRICHWVIWQIGVWWTEQCPSQKMSTPHPWSL